MDPILILITVLMLVCLALFVGKYLYFSGARKECDDQYSVLLQEISQSTVLDCHIMQQKVGVFFRTHRSLVSHDFLLKRVNRLYSEIKHPKSK